MRDSFLPFSPPMIDDDEIQEVVDSLRSGWITTGPKCRQFEESFAARIEAPGALALNSCTAALHTALAVLGVGPGDEVITTTMTFCSTVGVIEHVGATPVLVDVEPDTLNMDPARVAEAVSDRTKVILPVHYAGHPCDMDAIRSLAITHGIEIVEDAAHALPARYKDRWIGQADNPACFSFYATKNLTTAEGGMLTGSPDFIEKARVASLHGMSRDAWKRYDKGGSWYYEVVMPGFKYNMPDIMAAMGLAQLRKLERMQERRQQAWLRYEQELSGLPLLLPTIRPEVESARHLFPIRVTADAPLGRDELFDALAQANIGTSVHFIPIHRHPYYREKYGWREDMFPVADEAFTRVLSLPMHGGLSDDDIMDVVAAVRACLGAD